MMPQRQTWGQAQPLERETGYVPYREMVMWRRRAWWLFAIAALEFVLLIGQK